MNYTTDSSFDKTTEAVDVAAAFPDSIRDRTILITGVNKKGLGYAAAEAFATQSPRCLILAGRSIAKIQESVSGIKSKYPAIDVRSLICDLGSQKSVKSAAAEVLGWKDISAIHLVINNAGLMRQGETFDGPVPTTEDGVEDMFGTNHVGHYLLTNLIMPKIIAAASTSSAGSVRIINLSSSGTWVSPFRASDIAWRNKAAELPEEERPRLAIMKMVGLDVNENMRYIPTAAYGASKTCSILLSVGLKERLFLKYGILSLAVNPGEIKTELTRNTDPEWMSRAVKKHEEMGFMFWKTPGQGASTTLVAACDPKLSLTGSDATASFLGDCQITKAPAYAVDPTQAERLWQISEDLVGQHFSW